MGKSTRLPILAREYLQDEEEGGEEEGGEEEGGEWGKGGEGGRGERRGGRHRYIKAEETHARVSVLR